MLASEKIAVLWEEAFLRLVFTACRWCPTITGGVVEWFSELHFRSYISSPGFLYQACSNFAEFSPLDLY